MSLIFVTGISTSGKSTIAKELVKRGHEAYDTERNGISAWYNKKTGEREAEFNEMPERTPAWLDQHEWKISTDWVKRTAQKAKDKSVFLCGGSANQVEVRALCDKVIWLVIDEQIIRQRVINPRDHDYGTKPHELAAAIKANKINEAEFRNYGAHEIDASKPLDQVVDEILTFTASSR